MVEAVQAGLTVGLVMTERASLMTCTPRETVGSLVAKNANGRFSFVPVVKDGGIRGLYNAERWFESTPPDPNLRVEEDFEALTEDQLIGADASIQEFVLSAAKRPARLVVSGSEIVGLVCLADFQKLAVRAALFGLVTVLEMTMAERIEATWSEGGPEEWLRLLSPKRREKIQCRIASLRKNEMLVSEVLATEFADKVDVIVAQGLLVGSKTGLRKEFREIRKLRDALAHSNVFAATSAGAEQVARSVAALLAFTNQLRETGRR